jgi:3-methyladenine DNA glycosylase/8-oxoguanine DNA glycosylase
VTESSRPPKPRKLHLARIQPPQPFALDTVARSHGWFDLAPFRYDRPGRELSFVIRCAGGPAAVIVRETPAALEVSCRRGAWATAREAVRRVLGLQWDLEPFYARLAGEPSLSWAARAGAGRLLRAPTLWEDAVKVLLTTNCSWPATRGMVRRLVELYGERSEEAVAFPVPEALARRSERALRSNLRVGYRAAYLLRFARRVVEGATDLDAWENTELPTEDLRSLILEEPGFGPYAAEGLLRLLGRHDFYAVDSWTRQKYRRMYRSRAARLDRAIARRYDRFGPWRGLAFWIDLTRDWHDESESVWPEATAPGGTAAGVSARTAS